MQKRVRLTCKCGASYTLNTIHDFRSRCANERCYNMPNLNAEELWKHQESLIAVMAALGLGRDYERELRMARRILRRLGSSYRIDIVESPST
jgi:hypothetical protein